MWFVGETSSTCWFFRARIFRTLSAYFEHTRRNEFSAVRSHKSRLTSANKTLRSEIFFTCFYQIERFCRFYKQFIILYKIIFIIFLAKCYFSFLKQITCLLILVISLDIHLLVLFSDEKLKE